MASSSSLSFMDEWKYDVFISFRGKDTRSGFTGSLHRALCQKKVKSFMDDKDLEKGAEINPALDEAIKSSMIAVVVLSKNYASSTFCLDELRKIMDCSKQKGMLVLPVFYEVEPSDVRYQKGEYADALNKHKARINEENIEEWRVALKEIANLSGWSFNHDKYEYELIDIVVRDIIKKIHSLRDGEKDKKSYNGDDKYVTQHDDKAITINHNNPVIAKIRQTYRGGISKRAKLFRLNDDGEWDDQGTEQVMVDYLEHSEELGLFVHKEEDNETLLLHRITSDDIFSKQKDIIISWRVPEYATKMILGFQEPSGCSYIWDLICIEQRNMLSNTLNSNRVKSVEINSKEQKVTDTGYVEPNNVLEEAEIWPSVPYHRSTEIYADESGARAFDDSYIHMFNDEDTNSCSIM